MARGGLGLSAAQACLRHGARVAVMGRDQQRCQQASSLLGQQAIVRCGDATVAADIEQCVDAAVAEFGQLDGLYHVAGGSGRRQGDGPLDQITDEGWDYTVSLNLNSVLYSNRAATRQFLRQQSGGVVLYMTSVLASFPSKKFFATHCYAATKAAVIGLTKASASYYAEQNIRFNAIAPALVDTPLAARAVGDDAIMSYVTSKQPLDGGRVGRVDDIDDAVVYFLSDDSRFVTGQVLAIDGGWSVSEGQLPNDDSA